MIKIELICEHEPHRCTCKHNVRTQVDREEVTSELLKHNPALLKYFGKRINSPVPQNQNYQKKQNTALQNTEGDRMNEPYRSIVEQKGLKFVLSNNNNNPHPEQPPYQQKSHRQVEIKNVKDQQQPEMEIQPPQTITINPQQNQHQPNKQSSKEKDIKKYHKQLKNQSRYLSDTAFRKYFNRQCFQNYGRNNTSNKVDGFVYGNYMKTFNINPHTGQNMPINEQTFYHALVSGSPQKYELYNQEAKLGLTQSKVAAQQKHTKSLQKQKLNVQKMLEDNQKHSKLEHKYQHIRLKSGKSKSPNEAKIPVSRSPKNTNRFNKETQHQKKAGPEKINLPSQLQINTRKHLEDEKRPKKISWLSPKNQRQSPPNNFQGIIDQLRPNITSIVVQAPYEQKASNQNSRKRVSYAESIKQSQPKDYQTPARLECNHEPAHNSVQCACCVNKMKQFIIQLAQKDPDLANRILSSAKKTTLYKNFALNNFENAAMNPRNYRSIDGRLNVFEKQ